VYRTDGTGGQAFFVYSRCRDGIEPGAWLKGRIYEDECDLSLDGGLLVYFLPDALRFIRPTLATLQLLGRRLARSPVTKQ